MAEVFLGRDKLLDRPVAVKVLFPEYATDVIYERFRREAQAAVTSINLMLSVFMIGDKRQVRTTNKGVQKAKSRRLFAIGLLHLIGLRT